MHSRPCLAEVGAASGSCTSHRGVDGQFDHRDRPAIRERRSRSRRFQELRRTRRANVLSYYDAQLEPWEPLDRVNPALGSDVFLYGTRFYRKARPVSGNIEETVNTNFMEFIYLFGFLWLI